ncbi:MAG: ABC-type transporter, substrate-binding lipoprotein [Chlamydiia bacterium]|nr:ABC-type transporter, substrate-binding lipoprotein [Chlamydiia bacterium]
MQIIKKLITTFFLLLPILAVAEPTSVLITVAPYTEIVQKIGGGAIQVLLIVPQGADSHNYEPTFNEIQAISKAKIWFCLGEPFEARLQTALQSHNKAMIVSDLRKNLHLSSHDHCHCDHVGGFDPHIWMSPKLMITQAQTIAQGLAEILPEKKSEIEENLKKVINELQTLDKSIRKELENVQGATIMVGHPSYGYFCEEYHLHQFPIEQEGKDPTAKELTTILEEGRKLKIKKIFIQGYGHKGASLIAHEIGATVTCLNPYSPHYFEMMLGIAKEFKEASE